MIKINEPDLIWLAGLLEGEGNFTWTQNSRQYSYPRMSVGSTDADVIFRVTSIIDNRRLYIKHLPSGKIFYTWSVNGKIAIEIMRLLQPHMMNRRKAVIGDILERWDAKKQGNSIGTNQRDKRFSSNPVFEGRDPPEI